MAWRVAKSIITLHAQLKRGAPRAAPPATSPGEWGTIGDVLHDTTSDHAAKDFPRLGNDVVTAGDFPNRPDLGLDAHKVLDDIRRSRDPRAKYGISNGQIFSNHAVTQGLVVYPAWTWRPYRRSDGSRYADEHYTHGHLSVVGDARADGTQPWQTIGGPAAGEDGDMEQTEKVQGNAARGNTVGDVLSDTSALRDVWYGQGFAKGNDDAHAGPNPPKSESNIGKVIRAADKILNAPAPQQPAVALSAEDRAAIVADVASAVVEQVVQRLGALRFDVE